MVCRRLGSRALLSFDRYKDLFGFHLQVAARPRANSAIVEFLTEHKYTKNSIQPVFVPAKGALLLAGLDQHTFIDKADPERWSAKFVALAAISILSQFLFLGRK